MAKGKSVRNNRQRPTASSRAIPKKPVIKTPVLNILRDQEVTKKVFEAILESTNGRRAVSRFARTCKAFCQPALDVLWRELDSLVPIIGLFPNNLLKKARKPGLGLIKAPESEDWTNVLKYCDRVRHVTYNEASNNLSSVFPMLEADRPRTYILPNLEELTWKVQTASGLERATLFLSPNLKIINLEIESQLPQITNFLADLSTRTKLTGFSFASPTFLPDNFTELLHHQTGLEKIDLVAPGALGSDIGKWSAKLPRLKSLQLDLTGRSSIAVEGFFDKVKSGYDTPSSVASTDSGVFSNEEFDFSEFRKSARRLTDEDSEFDIIERHEVGPFGQLKRLQLSGDVSNINVFLGHLSSSLTHLELLIEDPPDKADWNELCRLVCDKFGDSLQALRITATTRSVPRGEPTNVRLPLNNLTYLPELLRLDIELPESVIFTTPDLERLAYACPRLECLNLCPLARFSNTAPQITLEALGILTKGCRNLHTIHAVVDSLPSSPATLRNRLVSSRSLLRLHVGYSWIMDPLQVSVLLSHLAPNLDSLRWFQDKNKAGYNEAHANNWQVVSETLPHLQTIRSIERSFAGQYALPLQRVLLEKCIDATVQTFDMGIQVRPRTTSISIQASPLYVNQDVDATVETRSICIDATPVMEDVGVEAMVEYVEQSIEAIPDTVSIAVETPVFEEMEVIEGPKPKDRKLNWSQPILEPVYAILASLYRIFIFYPVSVPSRILNLALKRKNSNKNKRKNNVEMITNNDISMQTIEVQ